jgi:hypothetical protein
MAPLRACGKSICPVAARWKQGGKLFIKVELAEGLDQSQNCATDTTSPTDCISSWAERTIIHRLARLFTIGILKRAHFGSCCCAHIEESRVRRGSAQFKIGSQSQCHVFRESMTESMPFASDTRPKKNSREIVPFRRGTDQPLEYVAQKFYPVSIWLLHSYYLVSGT